MRTFHALCLSSIIIAVTGSGCLGPGMYSGAMVDVDGAGAYEQAAGRRQSAHWEPTPGQPVDQSQVGRVSLQSQPSEVVQASATTGDPWAGSSAGVSPTGAMGIVPPSAVEDGTGSTAQRQWVR